MARTVTTIQQEIINNVRGNEVLSEKLTSTSKTAIWRLTAYVVAVSIWALEKLFDAHKTEVNTLLDTRQTHNLKWYANMAKAFQIGYALPDDTETYTTADDAAKIVAQASVTELDGHLIMKVAKVKGDGLAPLDTGEEPDTVNELTPFLQYVARRKDAGVVVDVVSAVGDDLRLVVSIMYDPLVLDGLGKLIKDSSREPAKETIKAFIQSLTFDGEFIPMSLVDALQATDGCSIVTIESAETKYAANDWAVVQGKVIPNAGYLTIADENLTIKYTPNV